MQAQSPNDDSSRVEFLRAVNLFEDIKGNPEALKRLAHVMREQKYSPATSIITEGSAGAEMYLLIHGQASVYKSTLEGDLYKVAILPSEPPALFGEGALLDSDARSATIKADTECHCLILGREAFEKFSSEYPQWSLPVVQRIAKVVLARLKKTNEDLSLLYHALVSEIRGH